MAWIKLLKASWSEKELAQIGALNSNETGNYNIYQDKGGELFITNHKLNDDFALMDTADTFEQVINKLETDWEDAYYFYDKELENEYTKYYGIEINSDDAYGDDEDIPNISDDELYNKALEYHHLIDLSDKYFKEVI